MPRQAQRRPIKHRHRHRHGDRRVAGLVSRGIRSRSAANAGRNRQAVSWRARVQIVSRVKRIRPLRTGPAAWLLLAASTTKRGRAIAEDCLGVGCERQRSNGSSRSSPSVTCPLKPCCALPRSQSRQVSRAAVLARERCDDIAGAQVFAPDLRPDADASSECSGLARRLIVLPRPHDLAPRGPIRSSNELPRVPAAKRLGAPGRLRAFRARRRRNAQNGSVSATMVCSSGASSTPAATRWLTGCGTSSGRGGSAGVRYPIASDRPRNTMAVTRRIHEIPSSAVTSGSIGGG